MRVGRVKYNDARDGKFQIAFYLALIMRMDSSLHLVDISSFRAYRIINTHLAERREFSWRITWKKGIIITELTHTRLDSTPMPAQIIVYAERKYVFWCRVNKM